MTGHSLKYDFIIAGAGISGLMLAYRMCRHEWFKKKRILLIDKEEKTANDRTWCYWEKGQGEWDHLLLTSWNKVQVISPKENRQAPIAPYQYKMLRSSAVYSFLMESIRQNPNIEQVFATINDIEETMKGGVVHTSQGLYAGECVFSSLFPGKKMASQTTFPYLKQHFIGWFVKTEKPVFEKEVVTFMDFRVPQQNNTRFMYVLPLSEHEALVEYTLFSENLLEKQEYEQAIDAYLQAKDAGTYAILEKEEGNIPMTCFPFHKGNTKHVFHIGSAGGWTKASTGFTFSRICLYTKQLTDHIASGNEVRSFSIRSRYSFFDLIFIDVLYRRNDLGSEIFSNMFQKNTMQDVLTFLDEQGSLWSDLKIIWNSKPRIEFVRSVLRNPIKLLTTYFF
jgi:lycopene beta-cyclase